MLKPFKVEGDTPPAGSIERPVVITSQWGNPTSNVATAGFVGILLGILTFVAGCIWLVVKVLRVASRLR